MGVRRGGEIDQQNVIMHKAYCNMESVYKLVALSQERGRTLVWEQVLFPVHNFCTSTFLHKYMTKVIHFLRKLNILNATKENEHTHVVNKMSECDRLWVGCASAVELLSVT